MGNLLSLQWWCHWSSIKEVTFNMVSFRLQMHGILLESLTKKTTKKIGDRLGYVEEVEDLFSNGQILHNFLRVWVLIDIN